MNLLLYFMRKRKAVTYRLDEKVTEALEKIARAKNTSVNRCVENILFAYCKEEGALDASVEPLGETRGGDRKADSVKEVGD